MLFHDRDLGINPTPNPNRRPIFSNVSSVGFAVPASISATCRLVRLSDLANSSWVMPMPLRRSPTASGKGKSPLRARAANVRRFSRTCSFVGFFQRAIYQFDLRVMSRPRERCLLFRRSASSLAAEFREKRPRPSQGSAPVAVVQRKSRVHSPYVSAHRERPSPLCDRLPVRKVIEASITHHGPSCRANDSFLGQPHGREVKQWSKTDRAILMFA